MRVITAKWLTGLFFLLLNLSSYAYSNHLHEQMMAEHIQSQGHDVITVAILVYPEIVLQDMAGPIEVFAKASKLTNKGYQTFTVAATLEPMQTEQSGLTFQADYTFETSPKADYLIIPGASMAVINALVEQGDYRHFIQQWYENGQGKIMSVCTGAYLLADTGLLNGHKATTHFFVAQDFAKQYPRIEVIPDVRFVDQGRFITSSGITSGIDAALHIVDMHHGRPLRSMIARAMQYRFHREEDWPVSPMGMHYKREP